MCVKEKNIQKTKLRRNNLMRRKVVGTIMFATLLAVVGCGAKNESNKEAVSKDAQEYTIDTQ